MLTRRYCHGGDCNKPPLTGSSHPSLLGLTAYAWQAQAMHDPMPCMEILQLHSTCVCCISGLPRPTASYVRVSREAESAEAATCSFTQKHPPCLANI